MEIANEGIFSNFFTKFKGRKEKADETHGSGKPMTFNEMANTSEPKSHNYEGLSTAIQEMYPSECEKEFKLRKAYLKEIMRVIPKVNKEFGKYGVITKDIFERNRQILNGVRNEFDYYNYLYLDTAIPSEFPESKDMDWYYPEGFIAPVCTYSLFDIQDIKPDISDDEFLALWNEVMTRLESFLAKSLSDSQCYGGLCWDGDNDGGNYNVIIVPSDQMIDLAMRVTSDPVEKKGLNLLKEYKKYMKKEASKYIGRGSEVSKEAKDILGVK